MISRPLRILALVLLLCTARAYALDGIAITAHTEGQRSQLTRHDIRSDKVTATRVLYANGLHAACISPTGDRVAFIQSDGALSLIAINGGELNTLIRPTDQPSHSTTALQWPASGGGEWIYYLDRGKDAKTTTLHRVNVRTKLDETVARFNRALAGHFALAPDATATFGKCLLQIDGSIIIYDLARGDGELYNAPHVPGGGASVSPDASLFTAADDARATVTLLDMTAQKQGELRLDPPGSDIHWSTNSPDWIAITQGADVFLHDWANQKKFQVTANPNGASDRAIGFWKTGDKQSFLGYFRGEAPFTLQLSDPRLHDRAAWDFGDDAHATGRSARHTYDADGPYTLSIKDGDRTFEAQVKVQKREPPKAVVKYVDPTHLVVDFDEPVQTTNFVATLDSGIKVARHTLNETFRRLTLELAAPLAGTDKLQLSGVTDRAQVPNSLEDQPLDVAPSAWPSNRADLTFLWEDAAHPNAIWDSPAKSVRDVIVSRDGAGPAGIDRNGRIRLDGGRMRANAPVERAKALSLETTIQTANLSPKTALSIIACRAFTLAQQDDNLLFSIDHHTTKFAKLPDTQPHHVCITYTPGKLIAYVDGNEVFRSADVKASLEFQSDDALLFGDNGWRGRLEGIALFNRFLEADEVRQNQQRYAEKRAARPTLPHVEVEAKTFALSPIPTKRQMTPYRDALVVNEFEVSKVIGASKGWPAPLKVGQRIRVAQWGVVEDVPTDLQNLKAGDSRRLLLEIYEKHPDKIDEIMTSNTLAIDPDVDLYYEPRP